MKKWLFLLPALLCCAGCVSLQCAARFYAGRHRGQGVGRNGAIEVAVETDAWSILEIRIVEQCEDELIGAEAMRELTELILEGDSTDVDAISGATLSSEGFLDAVNDALRRAAR
ncbi:MAG: FMN-binding protein [Spirochaetaceae bacterium]|nr:FMN-binding protein [Spirochaetaceae bacterium]